MKHCIIAPHLDDSFFSLGGHISFWHSRGDNIEEIVVFTLSNFCKDGFADTDEISHIRKKEELELCRKYKVKMTCFDYKESVVRGYTTEKGNILDFPTQVIPEIDDETERKLIFYFTKVMKDNGNICFYFPTAVGNHVDHKVVSNACINAVKKTGFKEFAFYEELPYAGRESFPDKITSLFKLEPVMLETDREEKRRMILHYSSQPVLDWVEEILAVQESYRAGKFCERIWRNKT